MTDNEGVDLAREGGAVGETLGGRLQRLRQEAGRTQEELAAAAAPRRGGGGPGRSSPRVPSPGPGASPGGGWTRRCGGGWGGCRGAPPCPGSWRATGPGRTGAAAPAVGPR